MLCILFWTGATATGANVLAVVFGVGGSQTIDH